MREQKAKSILLKIAAVTDKNLAEAIVKYQEEELTGLTGGHKG